MTTAPGCFTYTTQLLDREIRLMTVVVSDDGQVSCRLSTHSLDTGVIFDALSYVWGDATRTRPISCDGMQLDVTENLFIALQYIAQSQQEVMLWVDAVCINQTSTTEKTAQVKMMADIYARARQVIIWLGEEEETDRRAYEMASLIVQNKSDWDIIDGLPDDLEHADWKSLANLFSRPWFTRVWVLQEYTFAKSGIMRCGNLIMEADAVLIAAIECRWHSKINLALEFNSKTRTRADGSTLVQSVDPVCLGSVLVTRHTGQNYLVNLLNVTQRTEATDCRDKVFALIALSRDFSVSMIDYKKSMEDIQLEIAMQTLSGVGDSKRSPLELLSFALPTEPTGDSPTWIPSWALRRAEFVPTAFLAAPSKFLNTSVVSVENSKILRATGKLVDRIEKIIWPTPYLDELRRFQLETLVAARPRIAEWYNTVLHDVLTNKIFPDHMDPNEILWRTLAADGNLMEKQLDSHDRLSYESWVMVIQTGEFKKDDSGRPVHTNDFETLFGRLSMGRRVCRTQSGYLGWVPLAAREGDPICAYLGCKLPYVIRRVEVERNESIITRSTDIRYQLIGGCYLQGLMNGNLLDGHEDLEDILLI